MSATTASGGKASAAITRSGICHWSRAGSSNDFDHFAGSSNRLCNSPSCCAEASGDGGQHDRRGSHAKGRRFSAVITIPVRGVDRTMRCARRGPSPPPRDDTMTVCIRHESDGDEFVKARAEAFKSGFPASAPIAAKGFRAARNPGRDPGGGGDRRAELAAGAKPLTRINQKGGNERLRPAVGQAPTNGGYDVDGGTAADALPRPGFERLAGRRRCRNLLDPAVSTTIGLHNPRATRLAPSVPFQAAVVRGRAPRRRAGPSPWAPLRSVPSATAQNQPCRIAHRILRPSARRPCVRHRRRADDPAIAGWA